MLTLEEKRLLTCVKYRYTLEDRGLSFEEVKRLFFLRWMVANKRITEDA